ncbi:hypothetical protein AXK57_01175 [Tsukamurella pulmonis]|uniref:PucR family transcriptional regulator n=3 Tax=Tsukamurella pulmonis TaxID=47312 RepID=UPI0007984160|nr:helix-turn-helix domain-containing protein [Tsukamurella pulmonis]KXP12889.1 hypothetical protein AXK57_01175 [Tsukamurella pulmonis]
MSAESLAPVRRAPDLYDDQFARVLSGAGAAELVDAVVDGYDCVTAALVVDGADCEVARAPFVAALDPRRDRWVLDAVTQGRRTGRPVVLPHGQGHAVFHPATVSGRCVGGLLVLVRGGVDDGTVAAVGRFAGLFALIAARDLALLQPGGTVDLPVVGDLLTHHGAVDAPLRARAERAGIDLSAAWIVGVVGPTSRADLRRIRAVLGAGRGVDFVSVLDGVAVVLSRGGDAAAAAADVRAEIRRVVGADVLVCAAAVDDVEAGGLVRGYEAAAGAERVLRSSGRRRGAVDVASLPAYLPLLRALSSSELAEFVHSLLGPLREFDRATSADLVRTLAVFFEENMNTAATARRLGLHPNTVVKRQHRIAELLGDEWADGAAGVSLRLALSIDALAVDQPGRDVVGAAVPYGSSPAP